MDKLTKILFTFLIIIPLVLGYPGTTSAASDKKQTKNQIIKEMKEEIKELGSKPSKRGLTTNSKYIVVLEKQLEELKKQKEDEEKLKLTKDLIIEELEDELKSLGVSPVTKVASQEEINKDKDIIALRKQIEKIKDTKVEKKKKAEGKKKAEKAKEEKKQKRAETIVQVKKEIYFLGGTPIAEFEVESEDAYIEALKKQIEELKIQKEAEEKEIAESIPEWFLMPPQGSDLLLYVRGSAVSDQLQLALDLATNRALQDLGKKVETRLASKAKETIRQAGMGEDQVSKTEINLISSTVVDEVTVSGFEAIETKIVKLDNGSYRSFILLKYPVSKAYKTYMEKIEKSPKLKGRLTLIQNTDAYKDLEKAVAEYSGS